MIGADPDAFWSTMSDRDGHNKALWSEEDLKAYKAGFYTPESIHAVRPARPMVPNPAWKIPTSSP